MNQALYAHMNNKRKMKKKKTEQPSTNVRAQSDYCVWLYTHNTVACFPTHSLSLISCHFLSESELSLNPSPLCCDSEGAMSGGWGSVFQPSCLYSGLSHNLTVLLSESQSSDPAAAV
jgi:hypothetical protein